MMFFFIFPFSSVDVQLFGMHILEHTPCSGWVVVLGNWRVGFKFLLGSRGSLTSPLLVLQVKSPYPTLQREGKCSSPSILEHLYSQLSFYSAFTWMWYHACFQYLPPKHLITSVNESGLAEPILSSQGWFVFYR